MLMSPIKERCFQAWIRHTVMVKFEKEEKRKINEQIAAAKKKEEAAKKAAEEEALAQGQRLSQHQKQTAKKKKQQKAYGGIKVESEEMKKIQAKLKAQELAKKAEKEAAEQKRQQKREAAYQVKRRRSLDLGLPPPVKAPSWPTLDQLVDAGLIERKKFKITDLFKSTSSAAPPAPASHRAMEGILTAVGDVSRRLSASLQKIGGVVDDGAIAPSTTDATASSVKEETKFSAPVPAPAPALTEVRA